MSSTYKKINYVEEGAYGSTIERTLYAQFNATSDTVSIYDDNRNLILSYGEWGFGKQLDLGQALCKLLTSPDDELESCTREEIQTIYK